MTISPKPGHQPDPDDMLGALGSDSELNSPAHSAPEEDMAEEEAERPGGFA